MNILLCIDDNFAPLSEVMLESLFSNNPDEKIDVYVLGEGLSKESLNILDNKCNKYENQLFYIEICTEKLKTFNIKNNLTIATYYRLLASYYLPKDIVKILYLDGDIIISKNISDFYNSSMDDETMIIGVPNWDDKTSSQNFTRLGINDTHYKYINAGVMLINLELYRQYVKIEQIIEFEKNNKAVMMYEDQDIINALYYKYIKYANAEKYNFIPSLYPDKKVSSLLKDAHIIHFAGQSSKKPWLEDYSGQYCLKRLYVKYLKTCKAFENYSHDIQFNNQYWAILRMKFLCVKGLKCLKKSILK